MKYVAVIALALTLAGCGIAAKVDARQSYEQSAAAYKQCLATRSPQQCEGLRMAAEMDERKFTNMSAGIYRGGSQSLNVQNR